MNGIDYRIAGALGRIADALQEISKQLERGNNLKQREFEQNAGNSNLTKQT